MTTNANSVSADEMKARLLEMGECARNASRKIANASPELKNSWLAAMADALEKDAEKLIAANETDMKNGAAKGLSVCRQKFSAGRISYRKWAFLRRRPIVLSPDIRLRIKALFSS